METTNQKVWFITGASKGLGLSLAKQLLAQGHQVAATSRRVEDLSQGVGENDKFLPLSVDISNEESVGAAIEQVTLETCRLK